MKKVLTNGETDGIVTNVDAGIAHLVERHLAKVEVASSSLVARSSSQVTQSGDLFFCFLVQAQERAASTVKRADKARGS